MQDLDSSQDQPLSYSNDQIYMWLYVSNPVGGEGTRVHFKLDTGLLGLSCVITRDIADQIHLETTEGNSKNLLLANNAASKHLRTNLVIRHKGIKVTTPTIVQESGSLLVGLQLLKKLGYTELTINFPQETVSLR